LNDYGPLLSRERYGIKLAVFGIHELFYAGVEPNKKLLKDSVVGM